MPNARLPGFHAKYVRVRHRGMMSGTNRSVCNNLKLPFRRFTTNSFTGFSCRTLGLTIAISVLNLSGVYPATGEMISHGWEPSQAGGVLENGNNSSFTGGEGHHHKAAATPTRMTATAHFQPDRSRGFGPRSMSGEAATERSTPSARTAGTQRIPRRVQELQEHSWIRRSLCAARRRRELHA